MNLLLLGLTSLALSADPPPEPGASEPPPPLEAPALRPFDEALAEAKTLYFQGATEDSRERLLGLWVRLQSGEAVAFDAAADAMIYLGEIEFVRGDRAAAQNTFRWVLERDIDYPVSPFHHPVEVVHLFAYVRRQVQDELKSRVVPPSLPPPPPPPLPLWGYAPFGGPQFAQGQTVRGLLFGTAQAGLATASIVELIALYRFNGPNHPDKLEDNQVLRRVNQRRYNTQWPVTLGFYGLWALSYADGRRSWRRAHAPPSLVLRANPQGMWVGVARTF